MAIAGRRPEWPNEWWVGLRRTLKASNQALALAHRWKTLVGSAQPRLSLRRPKPLAVARGLSGVLSVLFVTPWTHVLAPPAKGRTRPRSGGMDGASIAPAQARIVANPVSGGLHGVTWLHDLREAADWLTKHDLPTELCLTDGPDSAQRLAEEAVRAGMRMVVAAGGDGTINQVIQALAHTGTALGVLPLGTVNVWAREMGIPFHLAEARQVLLNGVRRRIDLGRADNRYFLLMAGIGIDAEAARRVEHQFLKRIGLKLLDYIATGGFLGMTQRPARIWVVREGRRRGRHAVQILIGNTRMWGGAFSFTQRAVADDGLLDIVLVGGHHLRHRAQVLLHALLHRPSLGPGARYERMRRIRLESEPPLPVQVDGEVIGTLPMTFTACPRALTVIVPRDAPREMFSHAPLTG